MVLDISRTWHGWAYWNYFPKILTTYLDSAGKTLVFSDDNVFSYNRVERRCIIPPPLLGPTVWFPLVGSNLDVVLVLAGLDEAVKKYYIIISINLFTLIYVHMVFES